MLFVQCLCTFFYCCTSLQTCATYLAFGEFGVAYRSKRGGFVSRLEGYLLCGAPNVGGDLSHVWRVGVDAVPYNRQSTRVLCVNAFVCVRLRRAEKKPLERESG